MKAGSPAGPDLSSRRWRVPRPLPGAGLWLLPVPHDGNATTSDEEAAAIVALARRLLESASTWTDRNGECRRLTPEDILVVAPYNAHVDLIRERLHAVTPAPWRVGTVDKFQGQEAPIVIYAMGTSSPDLAPRGLEFLYSASRLNVATSRAKAAVVVGREPSAVRAGMPHTPADAARQRLVSLR
jgi:superfamily I DNA and/or RNA helicase